ncbi:MAG: hypothetical protein ABFE01_11755 [Phycisphaerales bacterium]|jgi:hypothetical protein
MMNAVQFEPMSVGRIFDKAFALYRSNFLRFITIAAVIVVPLTLVSSASNSWIRSKMPARRQFITIGQGASAPVSPQNPASRPSIPLCCMGTMFPILLQVVAMMLCEAVLIKNISEAYLGNDITIGQAYGFVFPKALTLIAAAIYAMLATCCGLLLFVVPGIIFGLWFSLTTPAIVMEGHSAIEGMRRSKALVEGNLGKVLIIGLLLTLIANVIAIPLDVLSRFIGGMLLADSTTLRSIWSCIPGMISNILVTPISAAAYILLYYDLRIRKEGFDLQMLAGSMTSNRGQNRAP